MATGVRRTLSHGWQSNSDPRDEELEATYRFAIRILAVLHSNTPILESTPRSIFPMFHQPLAAGYSSMGRLLPVQRIPLLVNRFWVSATKMFSPQILSA